MPEQQLFEAGAPQRRRVGTRPQTDPIWRSTTVANSGGHLKGVSQEGQLGVVTTWGGGGSTCGLPTRTRRELLPSAWRNAHARASETKSGVRRQRDTRRPGGRLWRSCLAVNSGRHLTSALPPCSQNLLLPPPPRTGLQTTRSRGRRKTARKLGFTLPSFGTAPAESKV